MKYFISILTFFVLVNSSFGQSNTEEGNNNPPTPQQGTGWYLQFTVPVSTLNIHFINKDTGWAGTLYTSNGGETWASYQNGRYVLQFVDSKHGWALSDSGNNWVSRTTNGGESWENYQVSKDDLGYATGKEFCDSLHGYIAYFFGYIGSTSDGGRTWTVTPFGGEKVLCFGCFTPTRVNAGGWGGDGKVYNGYTTDGGKQWARLEYPDEDYSFNDFTVVNSTTLHAVGGRSVLKTTNRGFTWKTVLDTIGEQGTSGIQAISATDSNNMTVVGETPFNGLIIRTKDGWETHEVQNSGVSYGLHDVFFIDSTTGWATGANSILHTSDAGTTWVRQYPPLDSLNVQVYPNPVSTNLNIGYTLVSPQTSVIDVLDLSGNIVASVSSSDIQSTGVHFQSISVTEISTGMYWCRVRSGQHESLVKFSIVR